jgi:hypothetical protein
MRMHEEDAAVEVDQRSPYRLSHPNAIRLTAGWRVALAAMKRDCISLPLSVFLT